MKYISSKVTGRGRLTQCNVHGTFPILYRKYLTNTASLVNHQRTQRRRRCLQICRQLAVNRKFLRHRRRHYRYLARRVANDNPRLSRVGQNAEKQHFTNITDNSNNYPYYMMCAHELLLHNKDNREIQNIDRNYRNIDDTTITPVYLIWLVKM